MSETPIVRVPTVALAGPSDWGRLAHAFVSWPKPPTLFERYERQAVAGEIAVIVADVGSNIAGYCLVEWISAYPPFAAAGIPEIADLNVLPACRGVGAGTALLDAAEKLAGSRSETIGLLVGLYADYGIAQRMYARRGYVPDGRGIVIDGEPVTPGSSIVLDDRPTLALTRSAGTSLGTPESPQPAPGRAAGPPSWSRSPTTVDGARNTRAPRSSIPLES